MNALLPLVSCLLIAGHGRSFVSSYVLDDPGEPLILTDYIKRGDIQGGRRAARVAPFAGGIESYSGYFTVNEKHDSNLFFWYFPAEERTLGTDSPVVLWLQGGGGSSMYGLFFENGPYTLVRTTVKLRPYRWTKHSHVIYVDNPDWVGFSFRNQKYYPTFEEISADLYSLLVQFFQIFPELKLNDFFVTGESYAGIYVPGLGYEIHRKNPAAKIKINLKGLAIGDGGGGSSSGGYPLCKEEQIKYLAENGVERVDKYNPHNYLEENDPLNDQTRILDSFLNKTKIKWQLHVGNANYSALREGNFPGYFDVAQHVEELLEHYPVTYYTGQLDYVVFYPCIEQFLYNLTWGGSSDYKKASRTKWIVKGELAGYVKTAGNLTSVLVRNAGHMVPFYQPKWAFDLISRIVRNDF